MSSSEPIKLDSLVIEEKNKTNEKDDDVVNPWNIAAASDSGVDYDKLIGNRLITLISF